MAVLLRSSPLPQDNRKPDFTIHWSDIVYEAPVSLINRIQRPLNKLIGSRSSTAISDKSISKPILNGVSGSLKSGQCVALMGPSGCGKTTLMKTIFQATQTHEHLVMGQVTLASSSKTQRVKVAFVPQKEAFYGCFTVSETLMFVSRLCHPQFTKADHRKEIDRVIGLLGLRECTHLEVSCLSGGQKKRLSLGQELISKPQVLFLDEPTTGLDSLSCHQIVSILQQLAHHDGLAVMASIHQPSSGVLSMFDSLYVLAFGGVCIYDGPPAHILPTLVASGYQAQIETNPAEHLTEIASREHGIELMNRLHKTVDPRARPEDPSVLATAAVVVLPLDQVAKRQRPVPFKTETSILFHRYLQVFLRDRVLLAMRIFWFLAIPIMQAQMGDFGSGLADGCYQPSIFTRNLSQFLDLINQYDSLVAQIELVRINNYMINGGMCYVILLVLCFIILK